MLENSFQHELLEAGCDEAGRGCLAGSVFAAAVILPPDFHHPLLNDSKQMSEKNRYALREVICKEAVAWAVQEITAERIDEINILNASQLAMRKSIERLTPAPDLALVDGNVARDFPCKAVTVIKGDGKSPNIAAASILAKVTRDRLCEQLHEMYPEYNIAKHKGYPTKEHMDAVRKYGPSPIHRMSFLGFLNKDEK